MSSMFVTPGSTVQQAPQSGRLLDYVERTTDLSITATSAGAADTWIDGNPVVYDGATRVKIEAFAAAADFTSNLILELYDGVTDLGRLVQTASGTGTDAVPLYGARILTPTAGSHTYHVKAWKSGGTSNISAAPTYLPAWYAITTPSSTTPGAKLDYVELTTPLTVTATSEGTSQTWLDGNSVSYDGVTEIKIEAWADTVTCSGGTGVAVLYDGATAIGWLLEMAGGTATGFYGVRFLTPSAGAHTYHVKWWKTAGTVIVTAGAGGVGTDMPAFLRITKS